MAANPISPDISGDTPATAIGVCHRTRMFGECLERVLDGREARCHWLPPEAVSSAAPVSLSRGLRLVLLDASLAADVVASLLGLVRQQAPCCKVLLIVPDTQFGELAAVAQWRADGCVRENGSLEDLCQAIRTLLAGGSYFPTGALISHMRDGPPVSTLDLARPCLTIREQQVLRLVADENLGNKQIARRLNVSVHTVKNHFHNLIGKLGVPNRQEAARLVRQGHVRVIEE